MISRICHKSLCVDAGQRFARSRSRGGKCLGTVDGGTGETEGVAGACDRRPRLSMSSGNYAHDNSDNSRVAPGDKKVVLDAQGPGVVTHMWFTFLGPERQPWAPEGSANHQEMLLRVFYDDQPRPAIEVPFGDFFGNCFGKRTELISVPVVVEDGDSYNCYWHMPFRKSIRMEVVNQSSKPLSLLYYNIDWIKKDQLAAGHAVLLCAVSPGVSRAIRQGLCDSGDGGKGALCRYRARCADPQSLLVRRGG